MPFCGEGTLHNSSLDNLKGNLSNLAMFSFAKKHSKVEIFIKRKTDSYFKLKFCSSFPLSLSLWQDLIATLIPYLHILLNRNYAESFNVCQKALNL